MKETREEVEAKAREGYRQMVNHLRQRWSEAIADVFSPSPATIRAIHQEYQEKFDVALDTLIDTLAEIRKKYA